MVSKVLPEEVNINICVKLSQYSMASCCSNVIGPRFGPIRPLYPTAEHIPMKRYVALIIHGFLLVLELQTFYKKPWDVVF